MSISILPERCNCTLHSRMRGLFLHLCMVGRIRVPSARYISHRNRLELALRLAPITLQAYIPGTNIRSYVLGNAVYAAQIRSASLDCREDSNAAVLPVALPVDVQEQCLAIARTLFLTWTAIDWRLTPWGDYVFLEANPSPMFLHFERQTGFPITQDLVHLLMQ